LFTDSGWILESLKLQSLFQFDSKESVSRGADDTSIYQLLVSLTNLREQYTRKYITLQQILASTGGFIQFFLIIFKFILAYHAKRLFLNDILIETVEKSETFHKLRNTENVTSSQNMLPVKQQTEMIFKSLNKSSMQLFSGESKRNIDIPKAYKFQNLLYCLYPKNRKNVILSRLEPCQYPFPEYFLISLKGHYNATP
jgi:hypothetical protein